MRPNDQLYSTIITYCTGGIDLMLLRRIGPVKTNANGSPRLARRCHLEVVGHRRQHYWRVAELVDHVDVRACVAQDLQAGRSPVKRSDVSKCCTGFRSGVKVSPCGRKHVQRSGLHKKHCTRCKAKCWPTLGRPARVTGVAMFPKSVHAIPSFLSARCPPYLADRHEQNRNKSVYLSM